MQKPWWAVPVLIFGSLFTFGFLSCALIGAVLEVKRQNLERKLAEVETMDQIEFPEGWASDE